MTDDLPRAYRGKPEHYAAFLALRGRRTHAVTAATKAPPAPPKPRQDGSLCVHRKGWIDDVEVKPCCGSAAYMVTIYGCKLHRKCADSPKLNGIHDCGTCGEFEPRTPSASSACP